ncbi:succinate dehydrogenase, cytochrome b556 subunit [Marinimicrobium sp. ABcell2]|uniref:succinate dehydrogenase, cytochrome b556 subunit n=1 Tax=Marinimicrobium sp. ABcell2 TaxID=3069751 RepID=UPI0027B3BC47|nr:succinate dehydrogenase, cytochrome b556 subunit [Marinimicrobium sp. ABcell2]MDQ2075428.1 succinate dehydrogenase, cytochrome b556 subunit [Marinimicrobium sp. ABcell2]
MKNQRPVNLDLTKFSFPLAAIVSILHRISGVFTFAGVAILLWLLDASLASEDRFFALQETLTQPLWQFVIWTVLAALAYHVVAGVRHMLMDVGIGESLKGGRRGAQLTVVLAVVLMILAGVWVW